MMQMPQHLAQLLHQAARGDKEQLTRFGQFHRRAGAIYQGQPQGVFQAANAPTEGWLGDEAALSRLGKAARGSQGDKIFQPFGFDVHHSSSDSARSCFSVWRHYADPAWASN